MVTHTHWLNNRYIRSAGLVLGVALTAVGCGSSPLQPSIGTAVLIAPADGAQVANISQPVTLVVQNATMTGSTAPTYTFEVAADPGFTTKVQTKDGIPQGSSQTSVVLDALDPSQDYYWHVRAQTPAKAGSFTSAFKFTIGTAILINAPAAISPANAALTSVRPTFTVSNALRQGPAGAITYEFDISTTAAFTSILVKGTVPEGAGQTSFTPSSDLPSNTALFWRAFGIDLASGIQGTPNSVISFTTGSSLWPGIQPPGSPGHAVKGDNWQPQTLYHVPSNTYFQSPTVEMLRFFDLFDKGFDPQGAIDWMNGHGYFTAAQWYPPPEKAVLGLQYVYLGARYKVVVNGTWDLVLKAE